MLSHTYSHDTECAILIFIHKKLLCEVFLVVGFFFYCVLNLFISIFVVLNIFSMIEIIISNVLCAM